MVVAGSQPAGLLVKVTILNCVQSGATWLTILRVMTCIAVQTGSLQSDDRPDLHYYSIVNCIVAPVIEAMQVFITVYLGINLFSQ